MQTTELTATDFRRISAITKEIGLNKGKGYSAVTVKAVLQTGTRTNPQITAVADNYLQKISSIADQPLTEKRVREIAREEVKAESKISLDSVADSITKRIVGQLKTGVIDVQQS